MRLTLMASAIVLALINSSCADRRPSIAPAQTGKSLYEVNCAICHGDTGAGDGPVGVNMTPRASRLDDARIASLSDDSVFKSVKHGVMRDGRQTMPPARDLTDEQISQLVAYLRRMPRQ